MYAVVRKGCEKTTRPRSSPCASAGAPSVELEPVSPVSSNVATAKLNTFMRRKATVQMVSVLIWAKDTPRGIADICSDEGHYE